MKNSSDTIGNQTRDLPTCSAVPQPTALPRDPHTMCPYLNLSRQISEKLSNIKFHENPSNGSTLFRSERDQQKGSMNLILDSFNFAKAPKKEL
jgi:hypothetical protein